MEFLLLLEQKCSKARKNAKQDIRVLYDLDASNSTSYFSDKSYEFDDIMAKLNILEPTMWGYISQMNKVTYDSRNLANWIESLKRGQFLSIPFIK